MAKWLPKLLKLIDKYFLVLIFGFFLLFTLPALLDSNHFLFNLEPYPDGLLYALSGKNFWLGRGIKLISNFGEVNNWIPPLYSLILGLGNLIFPIPYSFYLINIILGLSFLGVFYFLLKKSSSSLVARIIGVVVLLAHAILLWLPSAPLTENITLLFLVTLITSFYLNSWKKYLVFILSSLGLILTKYATFPLVFGGSLIMTWNLIKNYPLKKIIKNGFLTLSVTLAILLALELIGLSVLAFFQELLGDWNSFFQFGFVIPNLTTYLKMLLFSKGWWLWFDIGLSNFILFGLFLTAMIILWIKKQTQKSLILLIFFLAQLPLQLIFYTTDARYLVYSLPLIALGTAWLIDILPQKRKLLIVISLLGILLQVFLQRDFIKQLMADNLFGKSTAWQYESIKHFNNTLKEGDSIITALPPFLIDVYQTKTYRPLPLSQHQEFLQKKQFAWGDDINYTDLVNNYQTWLEQGRKIYISNAYVTHQQTVIADFEVFKEQFDLQLVSEDCLQACNIYQLELAK